MRYRFWLPLLGALLGLCGCKIGVGNGDFDGSFFDHDASAKDAARPDAARADAGAKRKDAGTKDEDDGGGVEDAATGSDAATHADAGHTLTPEAVPGLFAEAVCGALDACMGPVLLLGYLNGTPCVDLIRQQQADRDLHWLAESVTAGRVLLRPARFDDCLADLKAFGCAVQSRRLPQSCEDAIEGQVALHQACSIDYDCSGDAYCDKGLDTQACPGSCVEPQAEGLACKRSIECADHLVCSGGSCTAPLKEADACDATNGPVCPPGLVCQGKSDARKCQSLGIYAGKLGDSCDALGTLCDVGLVCESLTSADTSGMCKKPVDKDSDCRRAVPNECPTTQYCKTAQSGSMDRAAPGEVGICSDLPPDGGSCSVVSCAPGNVCVNEICRGLEAAGGACASSAECFSADCEGGLCVPALDCPI